MSEEKNGSYKGLTEARRRANKKYNDRFVEIKGFLRAKSSCSKGWAMEYALSNDSISIK